MDALAEIVADAKPRGIDTSGIEQAVNFRAAGIGAFRLRLAGMAKQERIRYLVDGLDAPGTDDV